MTEGELEAYLRVLVATPKMQGLWLVRDRGMPVFAHTIDVALLCLDAFPLWRERHPDLDLSAVVVGSMLHDLSKLASHQHPDQSHSQLMSLQPALAVRQAAELLDEVAAEHGLALDARLAEHAKHIVASHHGHWGKIRPRTPEALLVHRCDYHSATNHRLAPVDSNDILPLLAEGRRWQQVSARLGVGRAVVKGRLDQSCQAEGVREWVELLEIWQTRGSVRTGPPERARQLERARLVVGLARQAPDCLMDRIRLLLADGPSAPTALPIAAAR